MKYYYYVRMRKVGRQMSYGTGSYCSDEGLGPLFIDAAEGSYIVTFIQEISEQDFNVLREHYKEE